MPKKNDYIVQVENGQYVHPPAGKKWRVIGGAISHVTGTSSTTYITKNRNTIDRLNAVDGALPTGWYPLLLFTLTWTVTNESAVGVFTAQARYAMAGLSNVIIHDDEEFTFNGDAAAVCQLRVEEEDA